MLGPKEPHLSNHTSLFSFVSEVYRKTSAEIRVEDVGCFWTEIDIVCFREAVHQGFRESWGGGTRRIVGRS
jgi:hypothetical protein